MQREVTRLQAETHDVVVVGGGIHGAWVALRAVEAGLRVALIERDDFGAATSANSLKILHGGLRYLQHLDFARMRDSIRARREFLRTSPAITQPLPCLMPLGLASARSPWLLLPALLLNDLISADRNRGVPARNHLPRGRLVSQPECAALLEPLARPPLVAGARWWDGIVLDAARLVIDPLLRAAALGAAICNRVEALDTLRQGTRACGVIARDRLEGREFEIRGRVVVDASGPWAGRWSSGPRAACLPPAWLGATNLVLSRSLGISEALALSSTATAADPSAVVGRERRELFFVPWRGRTLIGTHYEQVADGCGAGPSSAALNAFIDDINRAAPAAKVQPSDIAQVHWGLLPAASRASLLPGKCAILGAGRTAAGLDALVMVIGEKLTSAPVLSARVLTCIRHELSSTGTQDFRPPAGSRSFPPLPFAADPGSGFSDARVLRAVRDEMALSLQDILHRRLGLADLGPVDPEWVRRSAQVAGLELGWSADQSLVAAREFLAAQAASACR